MIMKKILTPKQSLLKGYLKAAVKRDEIQLFKDKLRFLLERINPSETEEYNKNLFMQFLNQTYYTAQGSLVNTYGKTDLAIYKEDADKGLTPVVLFEFKGPDRPDMISRSDFKQKGMYELILYYLREEMGKGNHDITHLVVTDCRQLFIFEKKTFYNLFAKNRKFVNDVLSADRASGDSTEYIYREIIAPFVARVEERLDCTYINLCDFTKDVREGNNTVAPRLVAAYKLLSPTHLMRLPFAADHNTLDSKFYQELLYIMGLQEVTEDKKKVIKRLSDNRQHFTLMEQAYSKLDDYDDITDDNQRFDVAIGLVLMWVNRVLFLKLLESQLVNFNNSPDYRFLNIEKIPDYDALNDLFREVLAKPYNERNEQVKEFFSKVPYLNSSLFEVSKLEQNYFSIGGLRLGPVEVYSKTVLKDANGQKVTGRIGELEYLFRFLDAYDFGDTGHDETLIAEESKTIIDASVLGLIFEKINGYKDGSIFTPGYITQYICNNVIRKAVVDKFNEVKGWNCQSIDELGNHIDTFSRENRTEANNIINSLKICDPAVGSGHFLVSALNELLAVKSELGVLQDHSEKPKRITEYQFTIENDELMMTDEDGDTFVYNPKDSLSQRVQETLFEEKKTIIENCLFGVDLNPKSVEICQLRLWIELLKSAYYYKDEHGNRVLRTLPNIDINIRCGDSLVSVLPVCIGKKISIREGLKKDVTEYKSLVKDYVNCHDKKTKREIKEKISTLKRKFNPPIEQDLFTTRLNARQQQDQRVFGHALEWMIEFPEVLNEEGTFLGFDVIIGNPPYINMQSMHDEKAVYGRMRRKDERNCDGPTYTMIDARTDIYVPFVERAMQLLRKDGQLSFIIPNKWQKVIYGRPLRRFFLDHDLTTMVDFGDNQVFSDATTYTCIISMRKRKSNKTLAVSNIHVIHEDSLAADVESACEVFDLNTFDDGIWHTASLKAQQRLAEIEMDKEKFTTLNDFVNGEAYYGIKVGLSKAFLISQQTYNELMAKSETSAAILRPFLAGSGLVAYKRPEVSRYIVFIPKGFTRKGMNIAEGEPSPAENEAWTWFTEKYPAIAEWLAPFADKARKRSDKGDYWWELRACAYYDKFAEPKIMYQAFQVKPCFIYQQTPMFCNNSLFFLSVKDRGLLALLNSSIGWWLISEYCPRIQNGYQLIWDNFSQIPVPRVLPKDLDELASKMEQAVAEGDNQKMTESQREIDQQFEALYIG